MLCIIWSSVLKRITFIAAAVVKPFKEVTKWPPWNPLQSCLYCRLEFSYLHFSVRNLNQRQLDILFFYLGAQSITFGAHCTRSGLITSEWSVTPYVDELRQVRQSIRRSHYSSAVMVGNLSCVLLRLKNATNFRWDSCCAASKNVHLSFYFSSEDDLFVANIV